MSKIVFCSDIRGGTHVVRKFINGLIASYKKIDYIFMGALCLIVLYNSVPAGIAAIVAMCAVIIYQSGVVQSAQNEKIKAFEESYTGKNDSIATVLIKDSPQAACICDRTGCLSWANSSFEKVFRD